MHLWKTLNRGFQESIIFIIMFEKKAFINSDFNVIFTLFIL